MAKPMIILVKSFTYRDAPEEWSNIYHFAETPPANPTDWKTLIDALIAKEKTVYSTTTSVVRAYGYTDSDNDATYMYDYAVHGASVPGTLATGSTQPCPGDAAGWLRWTTAKHNTKGKTVYLRKYFHGVRYDVSDPDKVAATQLAAYNAFGTALAGGTGAITGFTLCGKDGTAAGTAAGGQFITTRTLKRRGKRPPS